MRQKVVDNGIDQAVHTIVWTAVQSYTFFRLTPYLSTPTGGYERHIVVTWFLLTKLVTHYDLALTAIKAIVRRPHRAIRAIRKGLKKPPSRTWRTSNATQQAPSTNVSQTKPSQKRKHFRIMENSPEFLAAVRADAWKVFVYISFVILASSTLIFPLWLPIFAGLVWLYRRRNAEIAAKKPLSATSEAFPYLVMWLVANAFGNFLIAKIVLMVAILLVKEVWELVQPQWEMAGLERRTDRTREERERLRELRRRAMYPGGRA